VQRRHGVSANVCLQLLFNYGAAVGDGDVYGAMGHGADVVLGVGAECILREEDDSVERSDGGDGSAGKRAGEYARRVNGVLPVWRRSNEYGRGKREIRHVLPGCGGPGLRGPAVLQRG